MTVVRGIALRPGVSRNRRRYTPEVVTKAHDRLAARLADPGGLPVTMRTFHPRPGGQDANVEAIAGHVTSVTLDPDGAIRYEAALADTPAGRTAAQLLTPDGAGRQHLASVSIRGYALGESGVDPDGNEQLADLEIDGLDLVDQPGVIGATATAASESRPATEADGRRYLTEATEAPTLSDTAPSVESTPTLDALAQAVAEAYACLSLDNGPADMRISGWMVDPADLPALVGRLAQAGIAALKVLDPDNDGDIDGIRTDTGDPIAVVPEAEAAPAPTSEATASDPSKEAPVAEPNTTESADAPKGLDESAVTRIVAEAVAAALAADRKATEEAAAAKAAEEQAAKAAAEAADEETRQLAALEAALADARTAGRNDAVAEMRRGGIDRKGLVRVADEGFDLASLPKAERDRVVGDAMVLQVFPHLANS